MAEYIINESGSDTFNFPESIDEGDKLIFNNTSTGRDGTIIDYQIPEEGIYKITAKGAQGGGSYGGKGVKIVGSTEMLEGENLKILVGHQGQHSSSNNTTSGGGGTFVVFPDDSPLIIAGGGGGCSQEYEDGHANLIEDGNSGASWGWDRGAGGVDGNGGKGSDGIGGAPGAGGFLTDGEDNQNNNGEGKAFVNGGYGGALFDGVQGGFGGGASARGNYGYNGGGGGGGYSGGGGHCGDSSTDDAGGGGGSYISTTAEYLEGESEEGFNEDHGQVIIEVIDIGDIETNQPTNIEQTTATLNGFLESNESVEVGFDTSWEGEITYGTTTEGDFSVNVDNLTASTTYEYRAYSLEDGNYEYGDWISFITKEKISQNTPSIDDLSHIYEDEDLTVSWSDTSVTGEYRVQLLVNDVVEEETVVTTSSHDFSDTLYSAQNTIYVKVRSEGDGSYLHSDYNSSNELAKFKRYAHSAPTISNIAWNSATVDGDDRVFLSFNPISKPAPNTFYGLSPETTYEARAYYEETDNYFKSDEGSTEFTTTNKSVVTTPLRIDSNKNLMIDGELDETTNNSFRISTNGLLEVSELNEVDNSFSLGDITTVNEFIEEGGL